MRTRHLTRSRGAAVFQVRLPARLDPSLSNSPVRVTLGHISDSRARPAVDMLGGLARIEFARIASEAMTMPPADARRHVEQTLTTAMPMLLGLGVLGQSTGTDGSENIQGDIYGDRIFAYSGNDTVTAGDGRDIIYGNLGDDVLFGNQRNDSIYGGQGNDRLYGGQDNDLLYGNLGNDIVYGNQGDDIVYGNQGDDALFGGQGADTLYGGLGNDLLFGTQGNDILFGNLGADRFSFGLNSGADVIRDFVQGDGDRIMLQGQSYVVGTAQDGNALLTLSGGGMVELAGVTAAQVKDTFFTP